MKSAAPGQNTSPAEVTNVSPHGFWIFVGERELFVPFNQFPWFQDASVREIANVQLPSPHHLYSGPGHRSRSRVHRTSGTIPTSESSAA